MSQKTKLSAQTPISVIVVSHGRPKLLSRCLRAIRQLDYQNFEAVVVADSPSLSAIDCSGLKIEAFDKPNISAARNAGIRLAAGDVCAFIDDDAVPEPMWLAHISEAMNTLDADAAAGFVRGRNGISFQSQLATVDREAETHPESVSGDLAYLHDPKVGHATKLVGTNMAIRTQALVNVGGFDEAYRYYLDDADISMRLNKFGCRVAVVPAAEVHHSYAASPRRSSRRAPSDLFEIGRSSAIYFRRHKATNFEELLERITRREWARIIRHMVNGTCEPRHVRQVLSTLDAGWKEGSNVELPLLPSKLRGDREFSPMNSIKVSHKILSSRLLRRRRTLEIAAELSRSGHRVSLFSFSLTPIRHRVRYNSDGVWVQTGGQFGRSVREGKRFKWCRFASRKSEEIQRVAKMRGI